MLVCLKPVPQNNGFTHALPETLNRPQTLSGMLRDCSRFLEIGEEFAEVRIKVNPALYGADKAPNYYIGGFEEERRDEIVKNFDDMGYRPAVLEELLSYVLKHTDDSRTLIALGTMTTVGMDECVPCVFMDEDGVRHLHLIDHGDDELADDAVYLYLPKSGDETVGS